MQPDRGDDASMPTIDSPTKNPVTAVVNPTATTMTKTARAEALGLDGSSAGAAGHEPVALHRRNRNMSQDCVRTHCEDSGAVLLSLSLTVPLSLSAFARSSSIQQSFAELLSSYTNRTKSNHWEEIPPERLLETLEAGYGPGARSLCGYDPARPAEETLSSIKAVLEWFREVRAL